MAEASGGSGVNTRGSKVTGPGQIVQRDVQPGAGADEGLDFGVGFSARQLAGRSTNTISGTGSPASRPISPANSSAIRAFGPCPAPRNLSTYSPFVIGFDDGRQRPALAQRSHIAAGGNRPEFHRRKLTGSRLTEVPTRAEFVQQAVDCRCIEGFFDHAHMGSQALEVDCNL